MTVRELTHALADLPDYYEVVGTDGKPITVDIEEISDQVGGKRVVLEGVTATFNTSKCNTHDCQLLRDEDEERAAAEEKLREIQKIVERA